MALFENLSDQQFRCNLYIGIRMTASFLNNFAIEVV